MAKSSEMQGNIFKIKRFSVHDGPGIRTSVFFKGCPLNCIWCHSPEGIRSGISVWHDESVCIKCGKCITVCKNQAVALIEGKICISPEKCKTSGECVKNCPTGSMQFNGSVMSVTTVVNEIEKDSLYYNVSGGGVTLTGGEPLYQSDFSASILKECRDRKIHTAIETCLFCDPEINSGLIGLIDLFIVDLKISDPDMHERFTGKSNEIIKENFKLIAGRGKEIIVRIPMIPGITETNENKEAIEKFVNKTRSSIPIEYISYNPLAENNYKRLGIPYLLK